MTRARPAPPNAGPSGASPTRRPGNGSTSSSPRPTAWPPAAARRRHSIAGRCGSTARSAAAPMGATRMAAGDVVRVWRDRPGSARRNTRPRTLLRVPHPLRGRRAHRHRQAGGPADGAVARPGRAAVGARLPRRRVRGPHAACAPRRAPDRPRHERAGGLRQDAARLVGVAAAVRATRAGARLPRRGPRRARPGVRHLARLDVLEPARAGAAALVAVQRGAPSRPSCATRCASRSPTAALLEVTLVTGRQNQIRAQAKLHGRPLARRAEVRRRGRRARRGRRRVHAPGVARPSARVRAPGHGAAVTFESPLPPDLRRSSSRVFGTGRWKRKRTAGCARRRQAGRLRPRLGPLACGR